MRKYVSTFPGIITVLGILVLIVISVITFPTLRGTPVTIDKIMQVIISLVVLGAALYVILSGKYKDDVQKWAFGAIGLIIGYWLPIS